MKRNLFGVFAVVLAIAFNSFTSVRAIDTWFSFDPTQVDNSNVYDPSLYTNISPVVPSNPANVDEIVAFIKVDGATSGANAEVYPANYSVVAHRLKPRVDVVGSSLKNAINTAITSTPKVDIANRVFLR